MQGSLRALCIAAQNKSCKTFKKQPQSGYLLNISYNLAKDFVYSFNYEQAKLSLS